MATKKSATLEAVKEVKEEVLDPMQDYVEIPALFYDKERYSEPVFVALNGKSFAIPRGVSGIKVPRPIKEILDRSEFQKQMATNFIRSIEGIKSQGDFN